MAIKLNTKLNRAQLIARNLRRRAELLRVEQGDMPEDETWPFRMPPQTYLALHPNGSKAALARSILGLDEE